MARANPIQVAYNAGELSPRMLARIDFAKYQNGVRLAENVLVTPQGGAQRRPGTRFVAECRNSAKASRLVPFEFSTVQAYILELSGDGYIRFYRNQGQIVADDLDTSITNGTFDTDLSGWTTSGSVSQSGGECAFGGTGYIEQSVTVASSDQSKTHVIGMKVEGTTGTDSVDLTIGTSSGGTSILNVTGLGPGFYTYEFTPGASPIYVRIAEAAGSPRVDDIKIFDDEAIELEMPYTEADLFEIQYAQSADVMWLVHPSRRPRKLTRTGNAAWQLFEYAPTANPFTSDDNYPAAVTFHEQRLWFAGTNDDPQKLWATKSGDFEDMTTGTADDDALTYTIASGKVNRIRWLRSAGPLIIGTQGGEWRATSQGPVITPSDVDIKQQTSHGSGTVPPIQVGNIVVFVQRSLRKLREFVFSFEVDSYRAPDLTLLSDHITESGIKEVAYQENPDSVVWCVRTDGQIAAMTYRREQDVVGWTRQVMGGTLSGSDHPEAESVASVPGQDAAGQFLSSDERDEVWVVVKRTINSGTKRYVEFFERAYDGPNPAEYDTKSDFRAAQIAAQDDAFYVDSGLTYDGSATDTLTGLSHLEGETVSVLADGAVHPDVTVSSGSITLEYEASKVHAGLPFTHKIRTLKQEAGAAAGTAIGKKKRIHAMSLLLKDTGTFEVGPDGADLTTLEFREVSMAMDTAVPLFTGEEHIQFQGDWERDPNVLMQGNAPTCWHSLGVALELQTNEAV